jgi:hypothetical protein
MMYEQCLVAEKVNYLAFRLVLTIWLAGLGFFHINSDFVILVSFLRKKQMKKMYLLSQ